MSCLRRYGVAILPLSIFVVLAFFLWRGLSHDPKRLPSALINQSVPKFELTVLTDPKLTITQEAFIGQISLLNIWATWCMTCRVEHPFLMDIAKRDDVKLFGLNYKDDRDKALQWLKTYGDPYQKIAFDQLGDVAIDFGVYGTPETFLIDHKGRIRYKLVGAINQEKWDQVLRPRIQQLQKEM